LREYAMLSSCSCFRCWRSKRWTTDRSRESNRMGFDISFSFDCFPYFIDPTKE
jgi:hypothetical protein